MERNRGSEQVDCVTPALKAQWGSWLGAFVVLFSWKCRVVNCWIHSGLVSFHSGVMGDRRWQRSLGCCEESGQKDRL